MNLQQIKTLLNSDVEKVFSKLGMKYEVFGDNIYSTCPVHESSDNPRAFSYSKGKGIWKCWTRDCQTEHRNDIFGLIKGALSNETGSELEFKDVLSWVKKEFGINTKRAANKIIIDNPNEFDELVRTIQNNISFPKTSDIKLDTTTNIPSDYFVNRGFSPATLKHFEVGDCKDKMSKLYERAIIPIHSDDGSHTIGYICRSIREYKLPKFLIYPKGFDKRFHFYNMHRAIEHAKISNELFIVEGQGDVWKLYEAGIYNVIGIFGKTLSKEQEMKLQRLPLTHIVVLTDNDQAGRESKIQLQRQLGRFYKLTFPHINHKDVGEMTIEQIKKQIRG